ncbi:MAG: hypothetical protein K9J37_20440 [Saprospiraceae bacterium]|nr:hypothetical protein [Saprospiraceae bacterium]MCF8252294.1 hypothetical protein [Saprospiraceae bacterium]MCF8282091.1 hypothetical protein [Bacteroidales bacterium]MCF8313935.1 hypothetical protein [Saprospiraceae bacterium]MCF8442646.1 hypothetical protein [Saprospiraceae bacterium]
MNKTPLYKQLEKELAGYKNILSQAAEVIQDQDVSKFPIFVIHQNIVDIGINIVEKDVAKGNWSINASTLEEFVTKQIIAEEKVEDFQSLYRSHHDDLCLFALSELGANFIFLPKNNEAEVESPEQPPT